MLQTEDRCIGLTPFTFVSERFWLAVLRCRWVYYRTQLRSEKGYMVKYMATSCGIIVYAAVRAASAKPYGRHDGHDQRQRYAAEERGYDDGVGGGHILRAMNVREHPAVACDGHRRDHDA